MIKYKNIKSPERSSSTVCLCSACAALYSKYILSGSTYVSFLMCLFQPSQFEQCLVQMLQSLKEPLEVKPGEINVRTVEFFIT